MKSLISTNKATELISDSLSEPEIETISLDSACEYPGRVLATDILADRDAPPFDRVMMDGICINTYNHILGSWRYKIIGTQAAGAEKMTLPKGEFTIEVMTGAPLPTDANAVIPVEKIDIVDGYALPHDDLVVDDLQFIHQQGTDGKQGDIVLPKGTVLGAAELATAASVGADQLEVYRLPKIHLLTTGDEVVEPHEAPTDYQIRRSHPAAIKALINSNQLGIITDEHLPDDPEVIEQAIKKALTENQVLILTGGISMGKFDWVAPLLEKLLGESAFHGVAQKPGKPFAYWKPSATTPPIFALPGNPVSVMATMHRYVLPALRQITKQQSNRSLPLAHAFQWKSPLPGILPYKETSGKITIHPPKNSGDYMALIGCDGFVEVSSQAILAEGEALSCL